MKTSAHTYGQFLNVMSEMCVCVSDRRVCHHDNSRETLISCSSAVNLPYCYWILCLHLATVALSHGIISVCEDDEDEDHCVSLMLKMVCVYSSAGIKQLWTFFLLSVYFLKHEIKILFTYLVNSRCIFISGAGSRSIFAIFYLFKNRPNAMYYILFYCFIPTSTKSVYF